MSDPAQRLAGWQDLLDAPDGVVTEVLSGALHTSPRPRARHGRIQGGVAHYVGGPFDHDHDGPDGWWIVVEPDVWFGPHDIVVPDVCGWRRSRLPSLPEPPVDVAPDWACEVLSPGTAVLDRTRKSDLYLRGGVAFLWLVDAQADTLEAFRAEAGRWVRLGGWSRDDKVRVQPFEAVEIELSRVFPPR